MTLLIKTGAVTMLALVILVPRQSGAETLTIEIVTEIREHLIGNLEGVKSNQFVSVNLGTGTATSRYETGDTLGIESINDSFELTQPRKSGNAWALKATGQTETGAALGAMASIDYIFEIKISTSARKVWVSGSHNEYPSYRIKVNGSSVYDRTETGNAVTGLMDENSVTDVFVDGAAF